MLTYENNGIKLQTTSVNRRVAVQELIASQNRVEV